MGHRGGAVTRSVITISSHGIRVKVRAGKGQGWKCGSGKGWGRVKDRHRVRVAEGLHQSFSYHQTETCNLWI